MKLLIPVTFGLEQVVKKQLYSLGFEKAPALNGRIETEGDWRDVARLNVFLRSGERVLIELASFPAHTFDELYDGFYAIRWEDWMDYDSQILMDGKSVQSRLAAIKAAGGVAKKAIIKRLADHLKGRNVGGRVAPSAKNGVKNSLKNGAKVGANLFTESGARFIVGFSIYRDEVTVTLDTSGEGLHKRGYRSLAYTAPLKETLAAGLIDLSFYNPDAEEEKPFADVFCGSGTLPIEAVMKAWNIAPGIARNFDFELWKNVPKDASSLAREEARDSEKRGRQVCVYGSDISPEAISIAKYHARKAGVESGIKWAVSDMKNFKSELGYGVMICNPPYGERLSDKESVKGLYKEFGKMFRALPDWSGYILTSCEDFERAFGKRADRKKKFSNGNIPCGLYTYFGSRPRDFS